MSDLTQMGSLDTNNEAVHNSSSNLPGSAANSYSLSVHTETAARHQQYESIVDTGHEQLTAQYETVGNNSLEHIDEQATQVNQVRGGPKCDRCVSVADDEGYWQVLYDNHCKELSDAEAYSQVLSDDDVAFSEQAGYSSQRVRQAASFDSYGYLQPVVNNDGEVHALPLTSLNSNDVFAADSEISNRVHPLYTAQEHSTLNSFHSAQGDTPPHPLYTARNHENRPQLPTPRVDNEPTSNTTSVNLKLPVRLQSFKKQRLYLVIAASAVVIATQAWLIIYYGVLHGDKRTLSYFNEPVPATTRLPQLTLQTLVTHSPASAKIQVRSAKQKSSFKVNSTDGGEVNVLSVSSEGQLLVGQLGDHQLHVYTADCSHVTSITLPNNDSACEAMWTPRGNVIYIRFDLSKSATISKSGDVIQQTNELYPMHVSVSNDGIIYLIHVLRSIYQSTDDGLTWSHMFDVADSWRCWQVIKVSTDNSTDIVWTLIQLAEDWRLRVYAVDKRRAVGDNVTWRDVTLLEKGASNFHGTVSFFSRLVYDGHSNIFVTDFWKRAVHVWSVSGQYVCQLVSLQHLPLFERIAIDTQRHVMYVGHKAGTVSAFELTYDAL